MIKKICLLLCLIITPIFLFSQDSSPAYSSDALNRLYIVGLQYFNGGELTQAEIAFKSIVAFPFREKDWRTTRYYKGKAHAHLGDLYFVQKRYKNSIDNYQAVVQEYPEIENHSTYLFKLGRSLILDEQEQKGIDILKNYIIDSNSEDKDGDNALYWIAQGYIKMDDDTAALKVLYKILRDYPRTGMAYDIRKLITDLKSPSFSSNNKEISSAEELIKEKTKKNSNNSNKIAEEKVMVDRIKEVLLIKEKLLQLKEKKLQLLESAGKARKKMLEEYSY